MARDPHWSVRIEVLRSLVKTGGTQAAPYLLAALGDHDILVKKSAASFLGELRSLDAVGTLVTLLCDGDIGRQAFDALLLIGEAALPLLHESARRAGSLEQRERIIDLIGRLGSPQSIPLLFELLGDPSPVIRLAVVHSFWNCRDASVPSRLAELREHDPDEGVRYAAKVIWLSLSGESGWC
jgi:HEAT repeat protein